VDTVEKTFHYTHDYFLLKHLTHFVDVGALSIEVTGTSDDALAFLNPNGTIVLLVRNDLPHAQMLQVQAGNRAVAIELPPDSLGTLTLKPA
jgi:glucosylceramidase